MWARGLRRRRHEDDAEFHRRHRGDGRDRGGGGTDFRPVFRYVDEHPELDPALLIYFTDGFGDCPERPPAYPVMWLLTEDGREQPWGQSVHFKNPCGGGDAPVSRPFRR